MKKETLKKIKENTKALEMILDGFGILQKNMVSKALIGQLWIIRKLFQQLIVASLIDIEVSKTKDDFTDLIEKNFGTQKEEQK